MDTTLHIRTATVADAEKLLAVYAPYILHTANTFEYDVPSLQAFEEKVEKITAKYPWLLCERNGELLGYAYGSTHRERTAYQWCAESTVYLAEKHHRKGVARVLYAALFDMMKLQGYYSIYASILSTNTASVAFHRAVGFEDIGLFKNIGYKLGEWHSNIWMQYFLQAHKPEPHTPTPAPELMDTSAFKQILVVANERINMPYKN
jgi:L-amino acid N-acyltransferase YncA